MGESFVHLHVHSHYSMMWGVCSVESLCKAAVKAGFSYLALTDTNGFYGLIHFLHAARKHGIRPIVGATLKAGVESAVVLAKTSRGYELLSELITRRHGEENFSLVRDLSALLDTELSASAWAEPGLCKDLAVLSDDAQILQKLRSIVECWVEVRAGPSSRKALAMAGSLGIPPIATNAVYFTRPEEYALHRLVRAIDLNRTLTTLLPEELVRPDQWLKSAEEMAKHLPNSPEALTNTLRLAQQCHTEWNHSRLVFPDYQDRRTDHFRFLRQQCREGIPWRYGQSNKAIEKRLAEELDLIRSKGFVDYFLVVADIVRRRAIHCGRGSAAASLVSYLLGITHVDPIRHNLLFGRFLNPHRKDPPDIDVDFPWDERDDLLEEIRGAYGPERVASVCNHVGFGARASVREVAKVYGIPAAEIKEVTRRVSHWTQPGRIRERIETHPKFREFKLDPPWQEIIDLAARLATLPRHLSIHCGGLIVVPDRICRYVPTQRSAKGTRVIQWEKDQAEEAGLVKIDLLGNRSLAVIRDCLVGIRKNGGKIVDYATLTPLQDSATLDLLKGGNTLGVFYVESPAMRQLQQKTQRGDFEHLVIHSSIIRPAANRYIQEYIQRLHGTPYDPIHPRLRDVLAETYGIMVYQEDVVRVSMVLAGFNWEEADGLRKVLSKKSTEQLSCYGKRFREGCAERAIPTDTANAVWDMFMSFAGYSFCKPHSASYALVSFKSAYLKAHYPAEFMAAVLSNGGGYYSTYAYISEARRMGATVLGPDINESDWGYLGKGKVIRMGLQQIQNVRREIIQAVLEERIRNGPFLSLDDFLKRVPLNPASASVMVKSGALDSLAGGFNRPQLFWTLETWLNSHVSGVRKGIRVPQTSKGPAGSQLTAYPRSRPATLHPPALPDYSPRQKWQQEIDTFGFVLTIHPLDLFQDSIRKLPCRIVPASELMRHVGRQAKVLGWPITRKEVLTREGEPMEFVSLEDQTALYEAVFFPKAFQRFCQDLDRDRAYFLQGRVESEFGAISLRVQHLMRI